MSDEAAVEAPDPLGQRVAEALDAAGLAPSLDLARVLYAMGIKMHSALAPQQPAEEAKQP